MRLRQGKHSPKKRRIECKKKNIFLESPAFLEFLSIKTRYTISCSYQIWLRAEQQPNITSPLLFRGSVKRSAARVAPSVYVARLLPCELRSNNSYRFVRARMLGGQLCRRPFMLQGSALLCQKCFIFEA